MMYKNADTHTPLFPRFNAMQIILDFPISNLSAMTSSTDLLPPQTKKTSQLQPKSRHLKSPQLNLAFSPFKLHLLTIILQQIRPANRPNLQNLLVHTNAAPSLPAKALIDAYDDTPTLTTGKFPARHIFVVLAALDRVEDQGWGACKADAREEGRRGARRRWGGNNFQWMVEVAGRADGSVVEGPGVGENGVPYVVTA